MVDPRNDKLAKLLVEYSCEVKKGDNVFISVRGIPSLELTKSIIRKVTLAGAVPFWHYNDDSLFRQFLKNGNENLIKQYANLLKPLIKNIDCYIGIAGMNNPFDLSDIPAPLMEAYKKYFFRPVLLTPPG